MRPLKAGLFYFVVVFAVGFLLGTIRVLLLVPGLGERYAELIEMPFMMAAMILAAKWTTDRYKLRQAAMKSLFTGLIAAALLLFVEFTVVLKLRGFSLSEYFAQRDPVAGAVYYTMVVVFALMPAIFSKLRR